MAIKITLCQLNPTRGAIHENASRVISAIAQARKEGSQLVIFPEMAICGYIPDDLLLRRDFLDEVRTALDVVIAHSQGLGVVIGTVCPSDAPHGKPLCNVAAVISDGRLLGFQGKQLLPTYDIFDEWRYFEPASTQHRWDMGGYLIGVTICEDIWPHIDPFCEQRYHKDPMQFFVEHPVDCLINLSASPFVPGKVPVRVELAANIARTLGRPVVLCNQVGAQDGVIFDGSSLVVSQEGALIGMLPSFREEVKTVDLEHHAPVAEITHAPQQELFSALVLGVRDYFHKQGFQKACLGISGGLDSSVVACIAVEALGRDNVVGIFLPSRFTSAASREDAQTLTGNLGIATRELSIEPLFSAALQQLEERLGPRPFGVAEENLQARIRSTILMTLSNREGYLVLNTGNKSELAVGYTTLYGDSCGAIAVIGDLLKRDVYALAALINAMCGAPIPERVITKPPSAELRPGQKDSDTLPEYAMLDTIIDAYVVNERSIAWIVERYGFPESEVREVVKKIHASEHKRRQCPPVLRVSTKAFSCGRRFPIVHQFDRTG